MGRTKRNEALRAVWFEAANEILATDGYGGLKLAPLCRRLGVTTGAFYHSFENWQEFTDSLLATWLRERTQQTIALARSHKDPAQRLRHLAAAGSELQHRTEAAIRVWAGVDDRVGAVQQQVDEARYRVVHDAVAALVGPARAEAFAVWAMSTLIGYELMAAEHDRAHLTWGLEQIMRAARAEASSGASQ
ncbi:TetR/AcrR family transcriptional regulator [Nocardioides sp. YIM 152588]|uniref:TetR/AcrR family transcriptional regulator n=1 Tax=Nocardioides sp. YIM 152588 TaxID=3158259 RepID=UPI0032E4114F